MRATRMFCLGAILLVCPAAALAATIPVNGGLVVHEWGTFTSVVDRDGSALDWRPLNGPADLPLFVCRIDPRYSVKSYSRARVRMETPVLYFYAPQETAVSVKVGFPKGQITEWYPQARWVGNGIDWGSIQVLPGAKTDFPVENSNSHYYPARETDAAPLRVAARGPEQYERFLFYRGLGTFDLPLSVKLVGDKVLLKSAAPIGTAVLFENRQGKTGYGVYNLPEREATLDRPRLEGTANSLPREMETMLARNGLYEKEAEAMIRTWRDTWFEEGVRVFYVLPRPVTDAILPITIEPRPADLVRVLVARTEIITPEMEDFVKQAVTAGDASAAIRRYGRFAEPILMRLMETTTDPAVKTRAARLLSSSPAAPLQ